jgi:hypothetical protein
VGCLERNKELGFGDVVDGGPDEEVDLMAEADGINVPAC